MHLMPQAITPSPSRSPEGSVKEIAGKITPFFLILETAYMLHTMEIRTNMKWNRHASACAVALAALFIVITCATIPASALKVEGARIALDIEPGKTYTSPIGISINPDESEGTYAIDVMGFGQSPDGTYTALDAAVDSSSYTARSLILLDSSTVHLKPGERAEITATITVPSGTRDGGRYAIILVHPAASASGAPAAFATAVAIPVFLTVKSGTISETGEISALEPPVAGPGKPYQVVTTFQNTGNYHYYSVVNNVTITNAQGNVVMTGKTEPFSRAIVPGQSVKLSVVIGNGLPEGSYKVLSRMEKQDGTLLDEMNVAMQVGQGAVTVMQSPVPTAPGFGSAVVVGCIAVALCLFLKRRI